MVSGSPEAFFFLLPPQTLSATMMKESSLTILPVLYLTLSNFFFACFSVETKAPSDKKLTTSRRMMALYSPFQT